MRRFTELWLGWTGNRPFKCQFQRSDSIHPVCDVQCITLVYRYFYIHSPALVNTDGRFVPPFLCPPPLTSFWLFPGFRRVILSRNMVALVSARLSNSASFMTNSHTSGRRAVFVMTCHVSCHIRTRHVRTAVVYKNDRRPTAVFKTEGDGKKTRPAVRPV